MPLLTHEPALIELGERQSDEVLERARSSVSAIQLAPLDAGTPADATIRGLSRGAIELTLADSSQGADWIVPGASCRARFTLSRECYGFSTVVLHLTADGAAVCLRHPSRILMHQRRRFWRTPVRASTTVELAFCATGGDIDAVMLNISPAGLACMVDRRVAEQIDIGDACRARFFLDGDDHPFLIHAEIKAKTPAAEPSRIILRLGFECDGRPDVRDRIDRATRSAPEGR